MIKTIAWYEFWFTVKQKSYYLITLGMPLIILGYMGMLALIALAATPGEIEKREKTIGLIDELGLLTQNDGPLAAAQPGTVFEFDTDAAKAPEEIREAIADRDLSDLFTAKKIILLTDLEAAKQAIEDETVRQVTVIPADYMASGKFNVYVRKSELVDNGGGNGWLSELIEDEILKTTELDKNSIARIKNRASSVEFEIGKSGEFEKVDKIAKAFSQGIPLAVAGVLILALSMNSGRLLTSIAEEKENKVMEIIISSVSADDLLFGKVIGIVCAGLLQIAIWLAMVLVIPSLSMMAMSEVVDYDLRVMPLVYSGVLIILGFIFYGCLLAGFGSMGSTHKEVQQLALIPSIFACIPFMFATVLISTPNGMAARIMSLIPFFSPVAMTFRLSVADVPLWDIGVTILVLLISIFLAVKFSARLFRAGVLMQGKKPGLKVIWKVLMQ